MRKLILSLLLLASIFAFNAHKSVHADAANLIANPSVETISPTNSSLPQSWSTGGWGTNTRSFSYLNSGHNGSHSLSVQISSYTSGDAKWFFNPVNVTAGTNYSYSEYYNSSVTTELDAVYTSTTGAVSYKYLGSLPASSTWRQYNGNFTIPSGIQSMTIYHIIYAVGSLQTDDYSLTASNAPQVNITNPGAGNVNGQVNLSANATDASGIQSVQFTLDDQNIGPSVPSSPYQFNWDSTSVANGPHVLKAIATNTYGLTTTSAAVSINVNNPVGPINLIPNSSMETVDPNNSNYPYGWRSGGWGTNTRTANYQTVGHTGNRSVRTEITQYTNGAAYWYNQSVPVTAGQMYDYSDYYQSNILSQVLAGVNMSDGTVKYVYLGQPSPSPTAWTKFETQFVIPAGAVSVSFFHEIYNVGWLATDDYSLTTFAYQGFNRPLVSITVDDGYSSLYNYGLPILQKYGLNSTDYIITGVLNVRPGYMTSAQVKGLYAAGQEIASHTVTHPDLTTLTASQIDSELSNSQSFLQNLIGVPVKDFASPFGTYSGLAQSIAANYYQSYRSTQSGYNAKNNFNSSNLLVQNITVTTTPAQVQAWVDQAKATNTWLILVYHEINPSTSTGTYNTYPADFDSEMSLIKNSGITVKTVNQALQEVKAQL